MTTNNTKLTTGRDDDGPWHMERLEERLHAETRPETVGEVRIEKDVVEEQRTLNVPLQHDELEVRRVAVDGAADPDALSEEHESVRIPLSADRLNVVKEPRVVEELEVAAVRHQGTQRVADTVRREEIDIEVDGDVVVREERA